MSDAGVLDLDGNVLPGLGLSDVNLTDRCGRERLEKYMDISDQSPPGHSTEVAFELLAQQHRV